MTTLQLLCTVQYKTYVICSCRLHSYDGNNVYDNYSYYTNDYNVT